MNRMLKGKNSSKLWANFGGVDVQSIDCGSCHPERNDLGVFQAMETTSMAFLMGQKGEHDDKPWAMVIGGHSHVVNDTIPMTR